MCNWLVLILIAFLYLGIFGYAYLLGRYADKRLDEIEEKNAEKTRTARSSAKNKKG